MLDTVGIKHYFRTLPNDYALENWHFRRRAHNPTWILNEKGEKTLPNLTLVHTPNDVWHLSAQVSLPKYLFGHNAKLPNQAEVNQGLQMMAEYIQEKSNLPFDADTATVSLIHYAYDINLTEPGVWQMVGKLSKRKLKPLQKHFYEDATIYFTSKSKSKQIRIYPKLQQVLSEKNAMGEAISFADGNLRFESCLLEKTAIDALVKKHGLPNSYAQTLLTEEMSNRVISELLDRLNFFDLLNSDKTDFQILRECFGTRQAIHLCGFLEALREHGDGFYKDSRHGISRSYYARNIRACRKAKVW